MLNRRQVNVQRQNLAAMCRISVKSLIDCACLYTHVDDESEEFINFCAVFEQMVSHRLRPYQKKVWLPGQGTPRHFWEVLVENHHSNRGLLFPSCIPNIEVIEMIKSPKAKLRAFIKIALMEKRLSDYLFWLLDNSNLIRESYLDGALMLSEEASVLCGDLIGLNAIDFNFCLKGNENALQGPYEISYAPFLKYKQSSASQSIDEIEMQRLSGKVSDDIGIPCNILTESNVNDILHLQNLEKEFRSIKEQKDYLEELVRLRERQMGEANLRLESMKVDRSVLEKERVKERKTMDACVLELQAEISKVRKENSALKAQVASLRQYKERMELKEVPMVDMATSREGSEEKPEDHVEMDQLDDRFTMQHRPTYKRKENVIPSDLRSIMSSVSDNIRLKEDTQSMVPLTGSLADVNVAMLEGATKEHSNSELKQNQWIQPELMAVMSDKPDQKTLDAGQVQPSELAGGSVTTKVVEEEKIPEVNVESFVITSDNLDSASSSGKSSTHELIDDTNVNNSGGVEVKTGEGSVVKSSDSDKEEEASTSEPEIINKSSSSSEVGDAAWELLDSEQQENRGADSKQDQQENRGADSKQDQQENRGADSKQDQQENRGADSQQDQQENRGADSKQDQQENRGADSKQDQQENRGGDSKQDQQSE